MNINRALIPFESSFTTKELQSVLDQTESFMIKVKFELLFLKHHDTTPNRELRDNMNIKSWIRKHSDFLTKPSTEESS